MCKLEKTLLSQLDHCYSYSEKLELLNTAYLKAKTTDEENLILSMINKLKFWGR